MKIDDEMLERYLDRVMLIADRRGGDAHKVRQELTDHLYAKVEGLVKSGASRQSAILATMRQNGRAVVIGYRLREPWRLVDIRARGVARGIIAFGPGAIGVIAFGGWSVGVIAIGGCSAGIFSLGGAALGLLAWGGLSIGGFAVGGLAVGVVAVGVVAVGVVAVGVVAVGGTAIGLIAQGAQATAHHALSDGLLAHFAHYVESMGLQGLLRSKVVRSMGLWINLLIPIMAILMAREEKRISPTRREDELWFD